MAPILLLALVVATIVDSAHQIVLPYHRFHDLPPKPEFPVRPPLPEFPGNSLDEQGTRFNTQMRQNNNYPGHLSYSRANENVAAFGSPGVSGRIMGRPTVRPAAYFNPRQDASTIRSSLSNHDLRAINDILSHRSFLQRMVIMQYYPEMKKDFEWKLHSSYRDLMVTLLTSPASVIVQNLEEALKFSTSVDENRLVELLGTLNNTQLYTVKTLYREVRGRELQADMTKFSLNKFTDFFSSYIEGNRDESMWVDHVLATKDAEFLKNSDKLSIDKSSYFRYFMKTRSFQQLNRTFAEFQRIAGSTIETRISHDFSGNVRTGLLNIVKSVKNRGNYFAEIIHDSVGSISKRDSTLIRVIVLRSELDMGDIEDAYARLYRTYLSNAISSKTSGDFRQALLSLI